MRQRTKTAVLYQIFVPGTKESILDSGAMAPIIGGTQGTEAHVRLVVVTGAGVDAELANVICPACTATDELDAIDTNSSQAGSTLLVERTKDTIISLAVPLKAKFKVGLTGTEEDPSQVWRLPGGGLIKYLLEASGRRVDKVSAIHSFKQLAGLKKSLSYVSRNLVK